MNSFVFELNGNFASRIELPPEKDDKKQQGMPIDVAANKSHQMFLTDLGEVFSWGAGSYGKLGLGGNSNFTDLPTRITRLSSKKIVSIACGEHHSVALDESGYVYSWGCGTNGRLGTGGYDHTPEPFMVESLKRVKIIQIACGSYHTIALTGDGIVYSWGAGRFGQLGNGTFSDKWVPTKVVFPSGEFITQISGGLSHSAAVTSDGKLYTWGMGEHGRLGRSGCAMYEPIPKLVSTLSSEKVRLVRCGAQFTIVLTVKGEVYGFGRNNENQLVVTDRKESDYPIKLPLGNMPSIDDIAVGFTHVVVLAEGEVYSWGNSYKVSQVSYNTKNKVSISRIAAGGGRALAVSGFFKSILGEELKQSLDSQSFTDVEFEFADGRSIRAHKIILSHRSKKLAGLIQQSESQGDRIMLPQFVDYDSFRACLIFLYSDSLPALKDSMTTSLNKISDYFAITRLSAYLSGNIPPPSTLVDDYELAMKDKSHSDLSFVVDGKSYPVHKVFLISRCKYFQSMLLSNMQEASQDTIHLQDVETETIEALLRYIYTDKVDNVTPTLAIDLLSLTNRYQVLRLKTLCEGIIEKGVDSDTVAYVWKAAKLYDANSLIKFCTEIIVQEWDTVRKSDTWKDQLDDDDRSELSDAHSLYLAQLKEEKERRSAPPPKSTTSTAATISTSNKKKSKKRRKNLLSI